MQKQTNSSVMAVPPAVKKALAGEPTAKAYFDKLPPSHRREYLKWIAEAKKPETLQRRVDQIVPKLLEKQREKNR
jgi:uncharacterized protein YdeI (YjbR/CyaY-like superfamily)